ncbi:MAG: hypothetical protein QOH17_2032 [Pseudonocardiales bacterium]|nr:hypothetical protein [Pseudonocardiales bacterium]
MTVRRDLHALEAAGEVRLVHGGATLGPAEQHHRAFPDDGKSAARERIAVMAMAMVGPSDTIVVDAGPTTFTLGMELSDSFRGSVITHLRAGAELPRRAVGRRADRGAGW